MSTVITSWCYLPDPNFLANTAVCVMNNSFACLYPCPPSYLILPPSSPLTTPPEWCAGGPACRGFWKLIVHISSQLHIQWCSIGSLRLAMVEVFTPQQLAIMVRQTPRITAKHLSPLTTTPHIQYIQIMSNGFKELWRLKMLPGHRKPSRNKCQLIQCFQIHKSVPLVMDWFYNNHDFVNCSLSLNWNAWQVFNWGKLSLTLLENFCNSLRDTVAHCRNSWKFTVWNRILVT